MTRRDRHYFLILLGMLAANLLTAVCCLCTTVVYRRRFLALDQSTRAAIASHEKVSVEAASAAMAVADRLAGFGSDDVSSVPAARVVGYGQSKSRNAIWIYADVDVGGVVHREYIQRIPFLTGENSAPDLSHL